MTAPRAKMARLSARWPSSSRSPSAARMTWWSPATDPPRSEAKPIWPGPRARDAVAAALARRFEVDAAPLGRRRAEQQRGARRRVDLVAMVHLDDLDVPILAEPRRRVADQVGEQVDAERHVRRLKHRDRLGGRVDRHEMLGAEPGRADRRSERPADTAASRLTSRAPGVEKSISTSALRASAPASPPRSAPPARVASGWSARSAAIARPIRPAEPNMPIAVIALRRSPCLGASWASRAPIASVAAVEQPPPARRCALHSVKGE